MTPSDLRLSRDRAALLVVDVQERLLAAMPPDRRTQVVKNATALVEGAKRLGIPVLVSEQYPKGIGPTVAELRSALPDGVAPVEKLAFSCGAVPGLVRALAGSGRTQVVVCGMETHVCVYQTARDLAEAGYHVFVVADAVASRTEENREVGLALAQRAGAVPTSTEAVLFDLLGRAGTPEFKAVSALIR